MSAAAHAACAAIKAGLRRAGYSEAASVEQARQFADRLARLQQRDRELAAGAEVVR